jgi:hypothetical protein
MNLDKKNKSQNIERVYHFFNARLLPKFPGKRLFLNIVYLLHRFEWSDIIKTQIGENAKGSCCSCLSPTFSPVPSEFDFQKTEFETLHVSSLVY